MKIKLTQLDFAVTSTQNTFAELTKKLGILNNDSLVLRHLKCKEEFLKTFFFLITKDMRTT